MNRMRTAIEESAQGAIELADGTGQRSFQFTEDFVGFAGHFPGYPILPAVLQILLAQLVAEQIVGKPLQFLALERAKFTQQLRPGDQIQVKVTPRQKTLQLHCTCELWLAESRASSFALLLAEGEV